MGSDDDNPVSNPTPDPTPDPSRDSARLDMLDAGGWFGYRRWNIDDQGNKQLRWCVELDGGKGGAGFGAGLREAIDAAAEDVRRRSGEGR